MMLIMNIHYIVELQKIAVLIMDIVMLPSRAVTLPVLTEGVAV